MWNGQVLAQSDDTVRVEGSHYFPPQAVNQDFLRASATQTVCPWKGLADYYTVVVDGKEKKDAAWFYPSPSPAAHEIRGYVAFWKGVRVERVRDDAAPWWRRFASGSRG
jgi:uncharacterized protein (DUF427 family)